MVCRTTLTQILLKFRTQDYPNFLVPMAFTTTRAFNAEEIDWEDIGHITGPYGVVNTVCFSPSGEFLAIGGEAGVVVVRHQHVYHKFVHD